MTSKEDQNKQAEDLEEKEKAQQEASAGSGDTGDTEEEHPPEECAQEEKHPQEEEPAAEQTEEEKEETSEEKEEAAEKEAMNEKYLRLMADFQNYKRRTEKEKNDIYAFANEKIVSELLNVIDNFERALAHGAAGDSFTEGMNMIFKQLKDVLEKAGVTEIEALGADFDPNFHNAVMTEDSDQYESGKVIEVLQKGYILNNRVIRPSMVKVSN